MLRVFLRESKEDYGVYTSRGRRYVGCAGKFGRTLATVREQGTPDCMGVVCYDLGPRLMYEPMKLAIEHTVYDVTE